MSDLGPVSRTFRSQRLRLHYLDWGNTDAPLLILQHGGHDHAHSWDRVARALSADWHVIAPDLRGHGDSDWSPDAAYAMPYFVYDFAQLIHQQRHGDVTVVGHSFGGAVALRYAGLYPERVRRLVAVEGVGMTPEPVRRRKAAPLDERWRGFIDETRALSTRTPRRYASIEEAYRRMCEENRFLTPEQARHLTVYGVNRNEDGSFSWKFDNYNRSLFPFDASAEELAALLGRITCPTLLLWGENSWASDPSRDGTQALFPDARTVAFADAGHWLHHDQHDRFMVELLRFLG